MVLAHRARLLGSQIPPYLCAPLTAISRDIHRLLDILCLLFLRRLQRIVQHDAGGPYDAVGARIHTESALRPATRFRVDGQRGVPHAVGYQKSAGWGGY